MDDQKIYRAALKLWGADAQTLMAFEEMAELQKELCKHARGRNNTAAIAEEIADVEIMLGQMKILHNCAGAVEEYRESKLRRLVDRCGVEVPPPGASVAGMVFRDGCTYFRDGTEPATLGPGVSFRLEDTSVSGPHAMPDSGKTDVLLALKELCRYSRSREDGGDYRWERYTAALEFAVSVLSELREIKDVRVSAEPNAPEAAAGKDTAPDVEASMRVVWKEMADILTGKREAPEGVVFNVQVNVEDTAPGVTTFPVGTTPDKPQEAD